MKHTGNTEAPSHMLIVQKNESKQGLSQEEKYLADTVAQENEFGTYYLNRYIQEHPEIIIGDEIKVGKNQYGNVHQMVWQRGDLDAIAEQLSATIHQGIEKHFSASLYREAQSITISQPGHTYQKFTFLPMPENKAEKVNVQLDLFDSIPADNIKRATAYINERDATVVQRQTARIISMVKTTEKPEHESIVLVTAKARAFKQYVYKLYSNLKEIVFPSNWQSASAINDELSGLSKELQKSAHNYTYNYTYEGDKVLQAAFGLEQNLPEQFTNLKPFYREGTLVIHNGEAGSIGSPDIEFKQATFQPSYLPEKTKNSMSNILLSGIATWNSYRKKLQRVLNIADS